MCTNCRLTELPHVGKIEERFSRLNFNMEGTLPIKFFFGKLRKQKPHAIFGMRFFG